jgi:hypothetical protein
LHEEYHCKAYNYIAKTQNIQGMEWFWVSH